MKNSSASPFPPVRDFLTRYDRYLVLGHVEPDGDCVSSQLMMVRLLRRLGRDARAFSEGPFDRPEIAPFEPEFGRAIEDGDRVGRAAAVVVDCSTSDRLGGLYAAVRDLPLLVVDHHAAGRDFGDLRLVDSSAPSVTYLIQLLMEALDLPPDREEARLLLFGLCTDTGFFRHLGPGSGPVFQAVARLVDAGVSPNEIYRMIYGGRELEKYRLLGRELARTESHHGGRLLVTWETMAERADVSSRGADELYRLLQNVRGAQVIAFLREESPEECSVGLRSTGVLDVGAVAQNLGGGGHRAAAGFSLAGDLEAVKARVLEALNPLFPSEAGVL